MAVAQGSAADGPPLSIAHVHWAMPPVVGGVESHLADISSLLAGRGHRVTVFTGTRDATRIPGVAIVPHELLDLQNYAGQVPPARQAAMVRELAGFFSAQLRHRAVDVAHGHNLHYFSPVPALALGRSAGLLGITLHHTYHSVWNDESANETARACAGWHRHHVWSHHVADHCRRRLRIDPVQRYPGVRIEHFAGIPAPYSDRRPFRILHPARLVPEKGAHLSILMLDRLRSEGVHANLVLTGGEIVDWTNESARYRKSIEQMIDRLALADRVEIKSVRFDEMPRLYAEADIVVYPSSYPEPLGLVPLEAMAAARPIIVTNTGGLPETVTDKTGYIIEPDDLDALVDRVMLLVRDPGQARVLGEAGRLRAREMFDLDLYVRWMVRSYRDDMPRSSHSFDDM
jgi:glycosyltransferase involved in cell wall biosynthesis